MTFFAGWTCAYAFLGGALALFETLYDADARCWQPVAICAHFVYCMSYVAISVIIFKGHRDESRHMLFVNALVWMSVFVTNAGKASPVRSLQSVGYVAWLSAILIYLPLVIRNFDRLRGMKEVGRSYALLLGVIIGGTMSVQLTIATMRKRWRARAVAIQSKRVLKISLCRARAQQRSTNRSRRSS